MEKLDTTTLLREIRKLAGPHVDVTCEPGDDCYRATCHPGFAFEDGELHELIAVFWNGYGRPTRDDRITALTDLRGRFARPGRPGYIAEPCTANRCDWCGRY